LSSKSCVKCDGKGYQYIYRDGTEYVTPCDCEPRGEPGIPAAYQHCRFLSYTPQTDDQATALDSAREWSRRYPEVKKGLLFAGPNGTGKTHLAISALREVAEKTPSYRYVDMSRIFNEIKEEFGQNSTRYISDINMEPLVLLDDLGAGMDTDWRTDVVQSIIMARYNESLPTLITLNLARGTTIGGRFGARVESRLAQMCVGIRVSGNDWRKR